MQKQLYRITVTLCSPLHICGGTDADGTRVPAACGGVPYIPASVLKGLLRSRYRAYLELLGPVNCTAGPGKQRSCGCPVCRLFGAGGFQPSRVILDNLLTEQGADLVLSLRTNAAIDRRLQTGRDGMLVSTRIVEPFDRNGLPVRFSGEMTAWLSGGSDAVRRDEALLLRAARDIIEIGSGKSRGFGLVRTEAVRI